jgi:hypothetical protein
LSSFTDAYPLTAYHQIKWLKSLFLGFPIGKTSTVPRLIYSIYDELHITIEMGTGTVEIKKFKMRFFEVMKIRMAV